MKRFVVFILFGLVLGTVYLFAQRKQVTEEYTKGTVLTIPYSMMPGKVSYSYIVSDDGEVLKDGAYKVNCSLVNKKYTSSPYNITLNGNHSLNANFLKGSLNGVISASYKLNVTAVSRISTKKEDFASAFKGNFRNGLPHGNFILNSDLQVKQRLNANYSNGKLVGAFSCNLLMDDIPIEYKGTLNAKGELTGNWYFGANGSLNDRHVQFQNNVLISETNSKTSTNPLLVELAKKYAAGTISKEQLRKEGVVVREDSLTLGDYASCAILGDEVINLKKLGGYDFSLSNTIKYEYLYEVSFFTEKGFEKMLNEDDFLSDGTHLYNDRNYKYFYIRFDKELNMPYVLIHKSKRSKDLVTGNHDEYYVNVYITDEQMAVIDARMYPVIMGRADNLSSFIKNTSYKDKRYLEHKINVRDWYEDNSLLNSINEIKDVKFGLSEIVKVKDIMKKAEPYEGYDSLLIYSGLLGRGGSQLLIKKSSLAPILEFEEKLNGRLLQLLYGYLQKLMVTYQKRYDIVDNASSDYFEISDLNDKNTWKNELYARIENLCPVVDCKFIEIKDNGEILFDITKRISKKKGNVTYRIPIQTKDGRFVVSSIDFNKATIVD